MFIGSKMNIGRERKIKSDLPHMLGHSSALGGKRDSRSHRGYEKQEETGHKMKTHPASITE